MKLRIKERITLFIVSIFLTFTVCIYAPVSVYVSNKDEFWFNLRIMITTPVVFWVVATLVIVLLGMLLPDKLYHIYLPLVFGAGLCFYLQGNFLSLRVGILNGAKINWADYRVKMWLNAGIWLLILCAVVALFLWKSKMMGKIVMYIAALLTIMQIGSLVVMFTSSLSAEDITSPVRPVITTEGLYEVGEENIIVFVLDTFDEEYFRYITEEHPEITDELDGFVFYDNYAGVYPTTVYSIAHFMGGKLFRNEMPMKDWLADTVEHPHYFDELTGHGYELYLYTTMTEQIPQKIKEKTKNYTKAPMQFYNTRTCFSVIYRLAACQYFPDIVKPYVWMDGTEIASTGKLSSEYPIYDDANELFKSRLDDSGLKKKEGKQYKFIHLFGVHEPYRIDEWGNEVDPYWEWPDCATGCMRIMLEYLTFLKENGVYDDSAIIITADHGFTEGVYRGVLSNPVFLIKEKGAKGELKTCSYEASQDNFGATIADLSGAEDVSPYGLSILDATEDRHFDRYCYQYVLEEGKHWPTMVNGNLYLVEYHVPDITNDPSEFLLTDVEYTPTGRKISHKAYCENCSKPEPLYEDVQGWKAQPHRHIGDYLLDMDK